MSTSVSRIFFSRFMLWIYVAIAGGYYLLPNLFDPASKNRFALSRLNLGIDLRGGTYITLGVDLDTVVRNRMGTENRSVDKLFADKALKEKPSARDITATAITYNFSDDVAAKRAASLITEELTHLSVSRSDSRVIVSLSAVEINRLRTDSVDQAISVIRNRVDGFGVSGAMVQQHGSKQIVVQLPGVDDPERVKNLITKQAHLEFRIVQQTGASRDALLDKFDGDLPPDLAIIPGEQNRDLADDETMGSYYLTSAFPDLTGERISDSGLGYDDFGRPHVTFTLDREGASTFRELTGSNIGRSLGIVLDGVMVSAPTIQSQIGAKGQISGNYTVKTASDLALVLRTGSFQAPVTYQEERRIGPSLGQDSITRGLQSCLIGLLLVLIFSLLFYRIAGLFAVIALLYNLFLIVLFLSAFDATLTLPGIAGMALTIGMAIDASILIYERIREELAEGNPLRKALNDGFNGAMVVILDSNITTFLTGLVLFYFGGPSIQGFATTLMAGIVATIFAGVYFLRAIFEFALDHTPLKKVKF